MTEIHPTILEGMENLIALMEHYRALLEARGFSRYAAEAMVIHYHHNICAEIDRKAAERAEAAKATATATAVTCTCAPRTAETIGDPHERECPLWRRVIPTGIKHQ